MSLSVDSYLTRLVMRLAGGLAFWPSADRELCANYFLQEQSSDGGFTGREGGSDLYYTAFATRSLAILGGLEGEPAQRLHRFLQSQLHQTVSLVDLLSFLFACFQLQAASGLDVFQNASPAWRQAVLQMLGQLRRPEGGYAKSEESRQGSTYQTFLIILAYQLLQEDVPEKDQVADFLISQKGQGGAFREVPFSKRSSTNPTAAAVASLIILDRLEESDAQSCVDFLCDMHTLEGGFRANTRIPVADLLSTFTAYLTLCDLGAKEEVPTASLQGYLDQLRNPSGGYRGALLDPGEDVEYSFYGVGTQALLLSELS